MIGPIPYIGGKNRLAAQIIAMFPEHTAYVEAFAGGAQVFFRKEPSEVEVLNDLDYDIVNFYRVCQSHYEELVRYLRFTVASRRWFDILKATDPATLTDIQRAGRFLYLQKNAFGGLVVKQHYHYGVTKSINFNPIRIPAIIEAAHKRLANAQIESLPYEQIIEKYDRPTTLFYLDPPYWERKLYKFNFKEQDFLALEQRLRKVAGKFILSLDDHPKVREIFRAFHIRRTEIYYTAQRRNGNRYGELLITNFRPAGKKKDPVESGS
ncbi:MAG: DNA adenine methylase [Bryobacteraceae bacterium]|jgi:DNA adenine methylase